MSVEVCSYRLSLRGKPIGSQVLRTQKRGRTVSLEAKLMLQGSLGQQTVIQSSRQFERGPHSLGFSEEIIDRSEKRRYELSFDSNSGLVKASRGPKDKAELPYIRAYQDPLGLLYQIRRLSTEVEQERVPMLGKDVVIERLGATTLETALGKRQAQVFVLYPGGSYVYVDTEAPHYILKLTQRFDGQHIEAFLTKIAQEQDMPSDLPTPRANKRRTRKRRPRRRRANTD